MICSREPKIKPKKKKTGFCFGSTVQYCKPDSVGWKRSQQGEGGAIERRRRRFTHVYPKMCAFVACALDARTVNRGRFHTGFKINTKTGDFLGCVVSPPRTGGSLIFFFHGTDRAFYFSRNNQTLRGMV